MKKIALLLISIPSFIFAQDEPGRFSTGFMIMPEYNSLLVSAPVTQEEVVPRMGFSTALALEFSMTSRLSLRTGIGYGHKHFGYNQNGLIFNSDIDPQLGIISESRMESDYRFMEVQVPLIIQYELTQDQFFVAGGLDLIYAVSGESEEAIFYGNGVVERTPLLQESQFNMGILLSAGYQFHFSRNLNLAFEPTFRYCMLPFLVDQTSVYNLGLKITLNVEF